MKIKAGDRIADLTDSWSGKVRHIQFMRDRRFVVVDLPNGDIKWVYFIDVEYNNELGCFIHERHN